MAAGRRDLAGLVGGDAQLGAGAPLRLELRRLGLRRGRRPARRVEGRADGGTDYYMDPGVSALFAAARAQPDTTSHRGRLRRS